MNNNDILRQLRFALDLSDAEIVDIFKEAGFTMNPSTLSLLLKKEHEDDFIPCANPLLSFFLNGLIIHKRGRREPAAGPAQKPDTSLSRNTMLKKLRIAMDLKEADMLEIMKLAGVTVSKSELGALFRTKDNKHYKECSDQFFQNFLRGLALRLHGRQQV